MFSSRDAFENDLCPIRDELLGEMYRASEHGLPQLVASVSPDVRALLALFCYRRSHLYALSLAIACSCSEQELVQVGGRVGHDASRSRGHPRSAAQRYLERQRQKEHPVFAHSGPRSCRSSARPGRRDTA